MSTPTDRKSEYDKPSKFGKFIQTYHPFLSSFVIGAAGLIATSTWQYRQSEIARLQAENQAKIAAAQAENSWRIERAEILSKNLNVLASAGPETVEQRYGVLLSLARGNILDAELSVSYALELGLDSPMYMASVLHATPEKSYARLASVYEPTCQQRFGVTRDVPVCLDERHIQRSMALTDLFADEMDAARRKKQPGPSELLKDERSVQNQPLKLVALFNQYLTDLFERRQMPDIQHFEAISPGARLITSLVLAPVQPNSFVAASESADIDKFHDQRAEWLRAYLYGSACNGECKGKLIDIMLTSYAEAQGRFDRAFLELFSHPRSEVSMALARLHSRLLQCQIETDDGIALRDRVLVPAVIQASKRGREADQTMFEDLLGLFALAPDPSFEKDPASQAQRAAWEGALAAARDAHPDIYTRAFTERRASAQVARKTPPQKLKRTMMCTAAEVELADVAIEE